MAFDPEIDLPTYDPAEASVSVTLSRRLKSDGSIVSGALAADSGLIAFGLSWFSNAVNWGRVELSKAAQFALSYDYALLGISNSIINVFLAR